MRDLAPQAAAALRKLGLNAGRLDGGLPERREEGREIRLVALLSYPPRGDIDLAMTQPHRHATHPDLIKRLKRAEGHLRHVVSMIEAGQPCADIAVQLQAVEKAVTAAKRTLIHDHIDHCLGHGEDGDLAELRALAKLL